MAKELDITIVILGNEGGFRDDSADMPIGLIINPDPEMKRHVYGYFGDSVEVTNGVKTEIGKPGTSSMISLVPLGMMPSTDGYRLSFAIDKFNPEKEMPEIDPVITSENTLERVFKQIAEYLDMRYEELLDDLRTNYKFATLDRIKHDEILHQLDTLGIEHTVRKDGDPLLFIRALQGVKDSDGKKLFSVSTGGANEHIMSAIYAELFVRGIFASTNSSYASIKASEKDLGKDNGTLDAAKEFGPKDLKVFEDIEGPKKMGKVRDAGYDFPQGPTTKEELTDPKEVIRIGSRQMRPVKNYPTRTSLVIASNTGANTLDWGNLRDYIKPVTWEEAEDGSGQVTVSGFFIDYEGKTKFYRMSFKTNDVVAARYKVIAANTLTPNPVIVQYEKTGAAYREMLANNVYGDRTVMYHVKNIIKLLEGEEGTEKLLHDLDYYYNRAKTNVFYQADVIRLIREVERYLLGNPSIEMEDGSIHQIAQKVGDTAMTPEEVVEQVSEKGFDVNDRNLKSAIGFLMSDQAREKMEGKDIIAFAIAAKVIAERLRDEKTGDSIEERTILDAVDSFVEEEVAAGETEQAARVIKTLVKNLVINWLESNGVSIASISSAAPSDEHSVDSAMKGEDEAIKFDRDRIKQLEATITKIEMRASEQGYMDFNQRTDIADHRKEILEIKARRGDDLAMATQEVKIYGTSTGYLTEADLKEVLESLQKEIPDLLEIHISRDARKKKQMRNWLLDIQNILLMIELF